MNDIMSIAKVNLEDTTWCSNLTVKVDTHQFKTSTTILF